MGPSLGIRITFSEHAVRETDERLFPPSRHRSARILKKLIRRHGGMFRKEPVILKVANYGMVAHPIFRERLLAITEGPETTRR